jgi:hypothetical protein
VSSYLTSGQQHDLNFKLIGGVRRSPFGTPGTSAPIVPAPCDEDR